jgi:hypothetical protein
MALQPAGVGELRNFFTQTMLRTSFFLSSKLFKMAALRVLLCF